jgi:hypothetical protein
MQTTIHVPLLSDAERVARARKAIREALDVLAMSSPDTFLGRKSYEPFPKERIQDQDDSSDQDRRMIDPQPRPAARGMSRFTRGDRAAGSSANTTPRP